MLAEVTGQNAQDHLDKAARAILGENAKPATRNRAVITPHNAILRHASRRGWCVRPDFERPVMPEGKTRWLTPGEAEALIAGASPHLKPLLRFFLCTGARGSEALDLEWSDVDLAERGLCSGVTKNGKDRFARLPPAAVIALSNLPGREGAVFRRDDGAALHQPRATRGWTDTDGIWYGATPRPDSH